MTTLEAILLSQGGEGLLAIRVDEIPGFGIDYEVTYAPGEAYVSDPSVAICGHGGTLEDAARALQTNLASGRTTERHHG